MSRTNLDHASVVNLLQKKRIGWVSQVSLHSLLFFMPMTEYLMVKDLGREPCHMMYSMTASLFIQNLQQEVFIIVELLKIDRFLC